MHLMSLGNVAVGSTFSALQSAGAIGLAGTTKAAIVGAGGTVGGMVASEGCYC